MRSTDHRPAAAMLVFFFASTAALASGTPAAGSESSDPRCAVWAREASFAASVAGHDAGSFAAHLAPGAVFINGRPPHFEGNAAIVAGWGDIIRGESLQLRWHPEYVAIGGDGRTAISRGPFTMENSDVNAEAGFRIGEFQSVWILGTDGTWRVMFDGGGPPPRPASEEEVRALQKSWSMACPFHD
jgi:ketosteroid isomerase-like protein